jgi:hypothetical protein
MYQRHVFDFGTAVLVYHLACGILIAVGPPGRISFARGIINQATREPGAVSRKSALLIWFPDMVPKWGLSVALTIGDILFGCFFLVAPSLRDAARLRASPDFQVAV